MSNGQGELRLSQSKDWDAWLSVVRAKATGYKVWEIINPAKTVKPVSLEKPTIPDLDSFRGDFAEKQYRHKIAMQQYKDDKQEYEKQENAMAQIISFIYDITTITNLTYIQKVENSFLGFA